MTTRPTVGGSDGTWGTELNTHLDVSLDADGKVDDGAAQTTSAAPDADAELANKKYVDDSKTGTADLTISTTAYASNPVSTSATWADINISAIVGTNKALVYLRVKAKTGAMQIQLRTNGHTDEVGITSTSEYGGGATAASLADEYVAYLVVVTDASGIIEHRSEVTGAGETFEIYVDAFFVVN